MVRVERAVRSGSVKAPLLGLAALAGLLAGLAIGRWPAVRKTVDDRAWQDVDELQQMVVAPSNFNFVETGKDHETRLLALIHDQLLHYDPVQNQLALGLREGMNRRPTA